MTRTEIDDDAEEALFRVFDHSQGLQRRTFRLLARGFFNGHGIEEMRQQAKGLLDEINLLSQMATPRDKQP